MLRSRNVFGIALLLTVVIAARFGVAGENPLQTIEGLWRSVRDDVTPTSFRLEDEKLILGDGTEIYVVAIVRDDRVVLRIAGTDEIALVATLVDSDRIDCYFPGRRNTFSYKRGYDITMEDLYGPWMVRSLMPESKEEWRIVIGKDYIESPDGRTERITIERIGTEFRVIHADEREPAITFTPDGPNRLTAIIEGPMDLRLGFRRAVETEGPEEELKRRMERNAGTIITALRDYAQAQHAFQTGRQGRVPGNTGSGKDGFADNFRNLYYGRSHDFETTPLEFLAKAIADAFAGPTRGAAVVDAFAYERPMTSAVPYYGYLFLEPRGVDFANDFGLVAYPVGFNHTGNRIFWIGVDREVKEMVLENRDSGLPSNGNIPRMVSPDETPDKKPELWKSVR